MTPTPPTGEETEDLPPGTHKEFGLRFPDGEVRYIGRDSAEQLAAHPEWGATLVRRTTVVTRWAPPPERFCICDGDTEPSPFTMSGPLRDCPVHGYEATVSAPVCPEETT